MRSFRRFKRHAAHHHAQKEGGKRVVAHLFQQHQQKHAARAVNGQPRPVQHAAVYKHAAAKQVQAHFPHPADERKGKKQQNQRLQRIAAVIIHLQPAPALRLDGEALNGFKQFTDGITQTQTAMWVLLGGNALNIIGNYVLIYGKFGFPEWGLLGAGISTLFSRIVMVIAFALIVFRSRRFLRYKVGFFRLGWSKQMFRKLNGLGWPVGLQMGMETASFSLSTIMVGWLGTIALASHQIMLTISQFTFMMFYGMGAAIAVRVSNFKGQNDMVNVRRSAYAGYHLILAMAVVLLSIVFLLRNQVGGWFTDSVEVSAMVSSLFLPFLVYQFGDGLQISFANALRGIADVKPMMFIAFISYFVISLPVGYLCGFVLGWGTVGVWMAFPFGLTSAGIMLWLRFRYKTKDK